MIDDNTIELIEYDWPYVKQCILDSVTDWSICIQAGGHHGTYPLYLSEMFRVVYTFEADPGNFRILAEKCNPKKNIIAFNRALSSYEKKVGIQRVGNSGQNFVVQGNDIDTITIDSLNLTSCGLIQLDIERHEMHAIIGAIKTIDTFKPVIILEGPETTNNACDRILEQLGYEFIARAGFDSVFKYTGRRPLTAEYKP